MQRTMKILGLIACALLTVLALSTCGGDEFVPPEGVVVTLLPNNNIHITWDAVSGARYYDIAFRRDIDSSSTRTDIGGTENTTFTHSPSSSSTVGAQTLYYYVKALSRRYSWEEGYRATGWSAPVPISLY